MLVSVQDNGSSVERYALQDFMRDKNTMYVLKWLFQTTAGESQFELKKYISVRGKKKIYIYIYIYIYEEWTQMREIGLIASLGS